MELNLNNQKQLLTEGQLAMMGAWIEYILNAMFGRAEVSRDMKVRGTPEQIRKFADALSKEKNYMEAMKRYGITDPGVMNDRYKLEKAIQGFEKETGLKWPFK